MIPHSVKCAFCGAALVAGMVAHHELHTHNEVSREPISRAVAVASSSSRGTGPVFIATGRAEIIWTGQAPTVRIRPA